MRNSNFSSIRVRISEDTFNRINDIKKSFNVKNIQTVVYYLIVNCDNHNLYKELMNDKLDIEKGITKYTYEDIKKTHQIRLDYRIVDGLSAMITHLQMKNKQADIESVLRWVLTLNGR